MGFKRSDADPCLHYKTENGDLIICLSWVDNCMILGKESNVMNMKNKLMSYFECDDLGEAIEYVGCALTYNNQLDLLNMTQPILVKSLSNEFLDTQKEYSTPAASGIILQVTNNINKMVDEETVRRDQVWVNCYIYQYG